MNNQAKTNLKIYKWMLAFAISFIILELSLFAYYLFIILQPEFKWYWMFSTTFYVFPFAPLAILASLFSGNEALANGFYTFYAINGFYTVVASITIIILNKKTNNPNNKWKNRINIMAWVSIFYWLGSQLLSIFIIMGFIKQLELNKFETNNSYQEFNDLNNQKYVIGVNANNQEIKVSKIWGKPLYVITIIFIIIGGVLLLFAGYIDVAKYFNYEFNIGSYNLIYYCGWEKYGYIDVFDRQTNKLLANYNMNEALTNSKYYYDSFKSFSYNIKNLYKDGNIEVYYPELYDFIIGNTSDSSNIINNIFINQINEANRILSTGTVLTSIGGVITLVSIILLVVNIVKTKKIKQQRIAYRNQLSTQTQQNYLS